MTTVHQQDLLNSIAKLMDSGKYSDLVIKCGDRRWNVHKAIVCSASKQLAAACDTDMRERRSGIIDHEEFDAATVERMISYMYTQSYDVEGEDQLVLEPVVSQNDEGGTHTVDHAIDINTILMHHAQVYGIGEYCVIPNLKILAADRFATAAKQVGWQAEGFVDVVKVVYSLTSPKDTLLRDALRTHAKEHRVQLARDDTIMNALAEIPDFAVDMFRQMVQQHTLDKQDHEQTLKVQTQCIIVKDAEIDALKTTALETSRIKDAQIAKLREEVEHETSVMDKLVDDLESLPPTCRNARCEQELPEFGFERKGPVRNEAHIGNWTVRCKCGCRLVA